MSWWARALNALLLGTWLGGWVLFAFVVAPVAFKTLASASEAGRLIGPILDSLHLYGVGAGVAMAGLAALGRQNRLRVVLPLCLAAICAVSQFGITSAIDAIRPSAFGIDATAEAAARFSQLHELSRFVYGIIGAGLIVLTAAWARRES